MVEGGTTVDFQNGEGVFWLLICDGMGVLNNIIGLTLSQPYS